MTSDLLDLNNTGNGLIGDITAGIVPQQSYITESLYNQKKRTEELARAGQEDAINKSIQSNRDLLASPGKLDRMVVDNTTDIYPYAKRPDMKGAEIRTDAVDKSMGDNPLAGSITAIKEKFASALADPRYAGVSHAQLLDAVKKDHLNAVGTDGMSLLDKANDYKYKKDNGFWSHSEDTSLVKLPGYDAYAQKQQIAHPYDTSGLSAIAQNVGFALAGTALSLATGGTATAAAIGLRVLGAAALAVPEFKLFDAAANAVHQTNSDGSNNWGEALVAGGLSLALTHKLVGAGTTKVLSAAMKTEKMANTAATLARITGKAPDALKAYDAGLASAKATQAAKLAGEQEIAATRAAVADGYKAEADALAAASVKYDQTGAVDSLTKQIRNNRAIDPVSAHVMGLTADEFNVSNAKPSVLFTALSDEGQDAVHALQQEGMPLDLAIIQRFNQEAALKKADLLTTDGTDARSLYEDAAKRYDIKSFNKLMTGMDVTSKATKVKTGIVADLPSLLTKGSAALGIAGLTAAGVLSDPDTSEAGMIGELAAKSGDVFNSVAKQAVEHDKFPASVTVQGDSLWNAFKKFGTTKAEFADLGLDKLAPGTKLSKSELSKLIDQKGLKIGEDVYSSDRLLELVKANDNLGYDRATTAANDLRTGRLQVNHVEWNSPEEAVLAKKLLTEQKDKLPQFAGYKAIKSEEGVVPGSYKEEFVTAERPFVNPLSLDEQKDYERIRSLDRGEKTLEDATRGQELQDKIAAAGSDWKDPHTNYNSTENPVGRFRYDIQEQPDGKKVMRVQEVQQGFKDTDPNVPQSLRDRWQELTVKKVIARAKSEGVDGISWSTGEQQRDLYDNALRDVADEARYNPDTKELSIFKDGDAVKGYPKVVEPDGIAEHIGKDPAKRLLESKVYGGDITPSVNWYEHPHINTVHLPDHTSVHVAQYGSVWKTTHYFENGQKPVGIITAATKEEATKAAEKYIGKLQGLEEGTGIHRITDLSMDAQWPGKLYGDFDGENFNYKATVPSLLQKYGKGEMGVLGGEGTVTNEYKEISNRIEEIDKDITDKRILRVAIPQQLLDERKTLQDSLKTASNKDVFVAADGSSAIAPKQPVMWLNNKTPSSFTLYSHPAITAAAGTAGIVAFLASGHTDGVDGNTLSENTFNNITAKSAFNSLLSYLGPNEAYAGVAGEVGAKISDVLGKEVVAKTTDEKIADILNTLFDNHYVGMPVKPGQVTMNQPTEVIRLAPAAGRGTTAISKVVRTFKSPLDGLAFLSTPAGFARVYGTVDHNISTEIGMMQGAITHDTDANIEVLSNILKPVLKGENRSAEIAKLSAPIQEEYNAIAIPMRTIEVETTKAKNVINQLKATEGAADGADDAYIATRIKEQQDKIQGLNEEYGKYSPQYSAVEKKYNDFKDAMLNKYAESRISYALEEPALMKDPKYAALYTDEERAAVQQLSDFMGAYKARAEEAGMPVIAGDFNHHSMDKTSIQSAFAESMARLGIQVDSKTISLSSFLERSKYSKQMIPDITRNMLEYIPDAEKRINVAKLWAKDSQDGWYAFSQNDLIKSNKVWNDYFDRLKNAYNPSENTLFNNIADKYTQLETLRLLFLAPSAAFKHLFKNEQTWSQFGFFNSMKHIPESAAIASRNAVFDAFSKMGLQDKSIPRSKIDLFARAVTMQRGMTNPLADLERSQDFESVTDSWLQKLNNIGGIGIRAVENVDRVHTVTAALHMAANKGMTAEQAMTAVYDTIIKNNYLGGALNPEWMKNPKVRALMLFQGTPFKIMERRLISAMALGNDVKTAFGVIKSMDVPQRLQELQGIGTAMLDGQNEFKKHLIYDALTGTKDAFGNSVSAQFVREAIITGGIIAGGSALGMDLSKNSLHVPFVKEGSSPELAVNPLAMAAWKTAVAPVAQDDKTFFPARFLRNYFGTTGGKQNWYKGMQPLIAYKMERLTTNDIPKQYKDSPFKYLFSVPGKD